MMHSIYLPLNDKKSIEIAIPYDLKELEACDETTIIFNDDEQKYILYKDFIMAALETFENLLVKAQEGSLELHHSIKKNIGYAWNVYLRSIKAGSEDWLGSQYSLWETPGNFYPNLSTWIYSKNEKIFLEITPSYPWHFIAPEKSQKWISYKEFMSTYQPCVIVEIDKSILPTWIQKVSEIVTIIQANHLRHISYEAQT